MSKKGYKTKSYNIALYDIYADSFKEFLGQIDSYIEILKEKVPPDGEVFKVDYESGYDDSYGTLTVKWYEPKTPAEIARDKKAKQRAAERKKKEKLNQEKRELEQLAKLLRKYPDAEKDV